MPAAGFCDTNNLFGALEIAGSLGEAGIQPLIGIKLRVLVPEQGAAYLPLYAASKQGYERLLALSSQSFAHAASPKEAALLLDEVLKDTTGLLAVAGAGETHLGQWAASNPDAATAHLEQLKTAFQDRLFIGIPRHDLPQEQAAEPFLLDAQLIRQALLNLLLNAVQAMPAGGELFLRTGRADGDRVRVEVQDTAPADVWEVTVSIYAYSGDVGVFDADDVTVTGVSGTNVIGALVIYKDTGTAASSPLIAFLDSGTGLSITPNGGSVTVSWDSGANRIFAL
jgi:hypothetical protein